MRSDQRQTTQRKTAHREVHNLRSQPRVKQHPLVSAEKIQGDRQEEHPFHGFPREFHRNHTRCPAARQQYTGRKRRVKQKSMKCTSPLLS